jgi:hypothetical protein
MFRKIVSNLPFSPALVGQLGFYSKKLRTEKTTRRLGLIFLVLALIVQLLAISQPAESVNASNQNDVTSAEQSLNGNVVKSISATNASQGFVDASSVTAFAGDQISYTVTVENTGTNPELVKLQESILDTLDYATLVDNGGSTLDGTTGVLSWPDITLAPNDKQTRTFVIRLLNTIPGNAQGVNNAKSYDCIITNTFGNTVNITIDCPTLKIVENIVRQLPTVGLTENILFASIALILTAYFYARTRQLEKEVHLIRRDASAGTI